MQYFSEWRPVRKWRRRKEQTYESFYRQEDQSSAFAAGAGMLSASLIARLKSGIPLPSAPPTSPSLLGAKMIKMTNQDVVARRIVAVRELESTLHEGADSVFVLGLLPDSLRVTSRACQADAMFENEFSTGLALVQKRPRRDHRHNQEGDSGAFKTPR